VRDDALGRLVRSAGVAVGSDDATKVFAGSVNGRPPYPLDQWNPSHCGHVDIAIDREGKWWHEGAEIKRAEIVSLFAGLLRREADGHHYLVTPVEKVQVDVSLHPLMVVDATPVLEAESSNQRLALILNSGGIFYLGDDTGLQPESEAAGAAYINLPQGLTALFTRAAWYRLVDMADENGLVESGGERYSLL
jgi:hypothetical protein